MAFFWQFHRSFPPPSTLYGGRGEGGGPSLGKRAAFIIEQGAIMKKKQIFKVYHILLTRIVECVAPKLWRHQKYSFMLRRLGKKRFQSILMRLTEGKFVFRAFFHVRCDYTMKELCATLRAREHTMKVSRELWPLLCNGLVVYPKGCIFYSLRPVCNKITVRDEWWVVMVSQKRARAPKSP